MRGKAQEDHAVETGDTLQVWYSTHLVGHIVRLSQAVVDIGFRYDPGWLAYRHAFPISVTMPLTQADYAAETAYPWFLNLLPEGRAREIVGRLLNVAEVDVFAILDHMGGDLPGALEVWRAGKQQALPAPSYQHLDEATLARLIRELPERPLLAGKEGVTMSAAGAQDKLLVCRLDDGSLALPLNGAASTHILKPRILRFRDSVPNEYYCLKLAGAAGLNAAPVSLGQAEDIEYLLVDRYDRETVRGQVRRIHQEDLCQATGFPPSLKYEWNHEEGRPGPSLRLCMDALGRTPSPALNKPRFLDAILFNVLVGNVDAHAKNYSLLIRDAGTIFLSPLYDVMNGSIYEGVTPNLAMKIAGKQRGNHIHGRHWQRFAEENGLSGQGVKRRVRQISLKVAQAAPDVAATLGAIDGRAALYQEICSHVSDCCRRMIANLDS